MKTKEYNWLLKLWYVTGDKKYVVSYVNVLDSTKNEVKNIVDEYRKDHVVVHAYKLETLL